MTQPVERDWTCGSPNSDELLAQQEARDNLRLIDHIADKIGLPKDQELSQENFDAWVKARSADQRASALKFYRASHAVLTPSVPDDQRASDDMRLASNVRRATIEVIRDRIKRIDLLLHDNNSEEAHKEIHELAHEFEISIATGDLAWERFMTEREAHPAPQGGDARDRVDYKIGSWLSAALEDPSVCAEMKADINAWFEARETDKQRQGLK